MEKFNLSLLIVLVIGGITIGNAFALLTHNESVVVDNDGPTSLIVRADTGQANILFADVGTRYYTFSVIDDIGVFVISDGTAGLGRLAIDSTGNIGIGHINPTEKLDVKGNIKLSGNILSDNDICIGSCP